MKSDVTEELIYHSVKARLVFECLFGSHALLVLTFITAVALASFGVTVYLW